MKIQKNTNQRKNRMKKIVLAVVLILAVGVVALSIYIFGFNGQFFGINRSAQDESSINLDKASSDEKKAGETKKEQTVTNNEQKNPATDLPPAPVPQADGKSVIQVDITAANQNNTTFQVRTSIGAVTGSGTCTLRINQGDRIFTATSSVQALPTTTTCQGFDTPMSELGPGRWTVSLRFENETITGTASKEVELR